MKTKQRILLLMVVCLTAFISCSKTGTSNPLAPVDARDQYVGTWQIHDSNLNNYHTYNYDIYIVKSNASDGVIEIYNFGDENEIATAIVNNDAFIIPNQTVDQKFFNGNGTISGGNSISYTYTNTNGWNYLATGTKK